jgi:hypothetical protein
MSISIGTAKRSSVRDTQVAWLRRREDSRRSPSETLAASGDQEVRTESRP